MKPERWRQMEDIYHAALERDADERASFLDEACAGDEALRRDVEALLAANDELAKQTGGFLNSPAIDAEAKAIAAEKDSSIAGEMIGHYRVVSLIGAGGMGEVWLAEDATLSRKVALKLLPANFAANAERVRRFEQEARAVGMLNHPNILTIHNTGVHQGAPYLVTELLEGEDLRALLNDGPLPLRQALDYARQIARGLAAAHEKGIVHRDLKPENLFVTADGRVKILDFGLAKLSPPKLVGSAETEALETPHTDPGTVMGTVGYMSPEQVRGQEADHRSDIFAFGIIFYEMLTGRRAFQGETFAEVMAAIVKEEPSELTTATRQIPAQIERVARRCLEKRPERRFHSAHDLEFALEALSDAGSVTPANPASGSSAVRAEAFPVPRRALSFGLAVGLILLTVTAGLIWRASRTPVGALGPILTRLTSNAGLTTDPALSPDGKLLAYASDRGGGGSLDLWLQQVPGGEPIQLVHHEADDHEPDFSPDGQKIAFRSEREGGGVWLVSVLGGEARLVAAQGQHPRFSPDGSRLAYWVGAEGGHTNGQIHVLDLATGAVRRVTPESFAAESPVWAPNGKQILFAVRDASNAIADWWVVSSDGGLPVQTGAMAAIRGLGVSDLEVSPRAWGAEGQRVIFSAAFGDSVNLWQVSISPGNGKVEGLPQRLTFGPGPEILPAAAFAARRVVFASRMRNIDIWKAPVDHRQGRLLGELQRLTQETSADFHSSVSPDGRRMAFLSDRAGNDDVWLKDLETGRERALTTTVVAENLPVLAPDATRVAFTREADIFVLPIAGGVAARACEGCGRSEHWSPDGGRLLYGPRGGARQLWSLDLATGQKRLLVQHSLYTLFTPRFSPDGHWVSFHAVTGPLTRRIFIVPYRPERRDAGVPESEWIAATDGSALDRNACWSPDGGLFYFESDRDGFRCIWAQRLNPGAKYPVGAPFPVLHFHHARRSLASLVNAAYVGLSATPGHLILSFGELSGNIWMLEERK